MKNLILILILTPVIAFSQQADVALSKFFAVQVDETVFLRWTITAGNTCEDTYVERSADGMSYERIGLIGGICGSPDQAMTYEFTDTLPLYNRVSYYRLELGFLGYSSPKQVEIIRYNDQGFFLGPNPFNDQARLAFVNEDGQEYRLLLSNSQGITIRELTTSDDEFIISGIGLASGLYIFRLFMEEKIIHSGKLIKN
jgi:hypothetical protein